MEYSQNIEFNKIRTTSEIFSDYWRFMKAEWRPYCLVMGVFVLPQSRPPYLAIRFRAGLHIRLFSLAEKLLLRTTLSSIDYGFASPQMVVHRIHTAAVF